MASTPYMFIFLCVCFFVRSEVQIENVGNSHSSEIAAVLSHLNSSSFRVYNYKEATLLHAHTKADITELTLDVFVECINIYPDIPCTEKVLTCHGFVQHTPEGGSQVLNDVNCKPKPEIIVEESSYEPPTNPTEVGDYQPKSIALSNEAVSSEVSEPFVAVRKDMAPCLGCPFDLQPNAEGADELVDLALEHVSSERSNKQALVKVLKLQQQVVAGVKYILVIELGPTICIKDSPNLESCPLDSNSESAICKITFLQKPWISKAKHIISNNCTESQEFISTNSKKNEISNEIDINGKPSKVSVSTPNFDNIAETGVIDELSHSRLSDLESQILFNVEDISPRRPVSQTGAEIVAPSTILSQIDPKIEELEPTPTPEFLETQPERTTPENEEDESKLGEETSSRTTCEESNNSEKDRNNERESRSAESSESVESSEASNTTVSELKQANNSSEESSEEKEGTTVAPVEEKSVRKRAIPQLEKISPEEKTLVKNLADFAAAALDNIDDDNHKRIILQILGAKKMVGDDGVYYHLIMRMGISRCLEDRPPNPYENCRENLFENYTKICKVQVYVNDDFVSPKVVKSQCQNIKRDKNDSNRTNYSRFKRSHRKGGQSEIDKNGEDVKQYLLEGLTHLNSQKSGDNIYKSMEVLSATRQTVAGSLYRIKSKLVETECLKNDQKDLNDCKALQEATPKVCEVTVWEKGWENFKKITITCEGEPQAYELTTTIRRKKRETILFGGPTEIDKNSDEVKQYVREGLTHLNSQKNNDNKYKSIEVLSATSQVVAGVAYRIQTKISETECSKNDPKDFGECNVRKDASPKTCEIKIWEKSWENFKQFTITCEGEDPLIITTSVRKKREAILVGGQSEIDKNSDEVKQYVREGLTHLNSQKSNDNKYKSIEVLSATSQVVAGVAYRIQTRISETECSKNDPKDFEECNVRKDASPKICEIKIWEKSWENFKQFTITCEGEDPLIITTSVRKKREAILLGGSTEIDKNSDEVKQYVREGLTHLNSQKNSEYKLKSIEVLSATSQVVAGVAYRIQTKISETECLKNDRKDFEDCNVRKDASPKICELKIWEKSWENFKQFTITCEGEDPLVMTTPVRMKRQTLPGGQSGIDKNSDEVKQYVREGLTHLNSQKSSGNKHKSIEVLSATSQVVAGFAYRIQTKIAETECSKNDPKDLEECKVLKGASPKICEIKVWEKSWENFKELTITCEGENPLIVTTTIRKKRQTLPGGQSGIDKNSDEVKQYVREGLTHLNSQKSSGNKHKSIEVLSATSQVVAGFAYRIQTKIAETECSKNDPKDLEECKVRKGASPKICEIKVWEKSWENFKEFTITCEGEDPLIVTTTVRKKRETLVGGQSEIDKNSDEVKQYVREGLTHLNSKKSSGNKHKSIEVLSATSQVVAGFAYRIQTKIAETECSKNDPKDLEECKVRKGASPKICEIKVWEKSWENFKQFTITCEGEDPLIITTTVRKKRQTLAGGQSEIDKNSDEVKQYVREGLTHLNSKKSSGNKHKSIEVLSATSQVVAGFAYRIQTKIAETECSKNDPKDFEDCNVLKDASPKLCEIKIWEKSWENFKQFTITCQGEDPLIITTSVRKKREMDLLGDQTDLDKNSFKVKYYLRHSLAHFNREKKKCNQCIELLSATSQVVSTGLVYRILTKIAETECSKNYQEELGECKDRKGASPKTCEIKISEKLWENIEQYTFTCEGEDPLIITTMIRLQREITSLPEGQFELSKKDQYVRKYLEDGLDKLDAESDQENMFKIDEILFVTKQIVSGHLYKIKAKVVLSDCKKGLTVERGECRPLEGATPQICDFEIFEALWISNSRNINITCQDDKLQSQKSGLLGKNGGNLDRTIFKDFIKKYKKSYNSKKEYNYRLKVFSENMMKIRLLNTYEQGTATYGVTQFADLTQKEFSKRLGLRTDLRDENAVPFAQAEIPDIEIPVEFDWRQKGAVTEVKNQQQCGSCWAFSVTGNVEGQYAIKHGKLLEFSEQELVDCDTEDQGCNGGLMDTAYRQIEKLGGLETEQDYPYDAEDEKCHFNRSLARVQLSGAVNISHDEGDMAKWLVANGPISIAINANAMQFYFGGVSHPFRFLCNPKNLDHGVLIVGYGVHTYPLFNKTLPYWIVKNSWGPSWGEQGYYRVYRGDGTCGLNQTPSSAIVV